MPTRAVACRRSPAGCQRSDWGRRRSRRATSRASIAAWTRPILARTHGVKEARVADLGGVFGELHIDPGDDVAERTVLERPSRSICRPQFVVGDLLNGCSPLSLQPAEPLPHGVAIARPHHVLARDGPVAE